MKHGDKLYDYRCGTMRTFTFISEGLSDPTCKETVYFCETNQGAKFQVSKDYYWKTEYEAIQAYLSECHEALPDARESIKNALDHLNMVTSEIIRVQEELDAVYDQHRDERIKAHWEATHTLYPTECRSRTPEAPSRVPQSRSQLEATGRKECSEASPATKISC